MPCRPAPGTTPPPTRPPQTCGVWGRERPASAATTRRPRPTGTQHEKCRAEETAEKILMNKTGLAKNVLCNLYLQV